MTQQEIVDVDASTFQKPLGLLTEVLAQKVKREVPKLLAAPGFVAFDLHVLIRQAHYTYDLLFYLNADETRDKDCNWRPAYSIVVLPLIRNMIDCLYNITAILQDPAHNGSRFRKYGYKKVLVGFDEDQAKYGHKPEWNEWIAKRRAEVEFEVRRQGLTVVDVLAETEWPTLGRYIRNPQQGGTFTPHQQFLKTLLYGPWREYSAMAHGGSDGLLQTGVFYITDSMPHEERPTDDQHWRFVSKHLAQAASVLLCIVTELQAHFHFDGANIDERIHKMWSALMPSFVVQGLFSERYEKLMKDKGICP